MEGVGHTGNQLKKTLIIQNSIIQKIFILIVSYCYSLTAPNKIYQHFKNYGRK